MINPYLPPGESRHDFSGQLFRKTFELASMEAKKIASDKLYLTAIDFNSKSWEYNQRYVGSILSGLLSPDTLQEAFFKSATISVAAIAAERMEYEHLFRLYTENIYSGPERKILKEEIKYRIGLAVEDFIL